MARARKNAPPLNVISDVVIKETGGKSAMVGRASSSDGYWISSSPGVVNESPAPTQNAPRDLVMSMFFLVYIKKELQRDFNGRPLIRPTLSAHFV